MPAVRGLDFPAGRVHAFVHGEATFVKDLRRHLRRRPRPAAAPAVDLRLTGGAAMNEDGWQSTKREWNQSVEREQDAS